PREGELETVRRAGHGNDEDASAELEARAAEAAVRGEPVCRRAPPIGASIAAPLFDGRQVLGVVVAGGVDPGEERRRAARLVAAQIAANWKNARQLADLRQMAVVDPLTGLFNRRFFERQLRVEIERARRHRRNVSLAIIDVDGFKRFNALNGYDVGDQVIRDTAEVLRGNFREVDVVTRWGGDEFAVILPETGRQRVAETAKGGPVHFVDRVRRAVAAHRFPAAPSGRVTISAGVATYPADAADPKSIFQLANQALLAAKRGGHNRVCLAGPDGRIECVTLEGDAAAP
ncbi:MAG TPA: GGDEF domain-containing protein, partial [Planctomycetota bacterium]|nr:GGDEF domain-containing protein [Planctomycetota bacterium]